MLALVIAASLVAEPDVAAAKAALADWGGKIKSLRTVWDTEDKSSAVARKEIGIDAAGSVGAEMESGAESAWGRPERFGRWVPFFAPAAC